MPYTAASNKRLRRRPRSAVRMISLNAVRGPAKHEDMKQAPPAVICSRLTLDCWEVPMTQTVFCGVDFHARTQTVAYCDSATGEVQIKQLDHHSDDLRQFYSQFHGKVIVGLESCGFSLWFEQLLDE